MTRQRFLDPSRSDLARAGGTFRPFTRFASTTGFFTSAALFVDGLPCSLFSYSFGRPPLFTAFLNVLSLAFLFIGISRFGSARHDFNLFGLNSSKFASA